MLTNFQNGVTSFGIPQIGGGVALSVPRFDAVDSVFFVDPSFNQIANFGGPRVYNTITQAINAAPNAATILIFPGSYEETLSVTKDYITLIGAQYAGYARPDILGAASGAVPLTVTGQGFRAVNCRFVGTAADSVLQRGNGFEFVNCVFDGDLTAAKCGLRLKPSDTDDSFTASEGRVAGNLFRSNAIGIGFDTAAALVGVGSTDNLIEGNIFDRNTLDLSSLDTGAGTYSLQFTKILSNQFIDKNKATYIDFTTTNGGAAGDQSGVVNGNYFASDTMTTTKIKAVGTAFTFSGNVITTGIFDGSSLD